MKDLKTELNKVYSAYKVDDLRSKRLEQSILAQIETIKQPFYFQAKYLRIASVFVVALSYLVFHQTQKKSSQEDILAMQLDAIASSLDETMLTQTTLSVSSPTDQIYLALSKKLENLDYNQLKDIMEDI